MNDLSLFGAMYLHKRPAPSPAPAGSQREKAAPQTPAPAASGSAHKTHGSASKAAARNIEESFGLEDLIKETFESLALLERVKQQAEAPAGAAISAAMAAAPSTPAPRTARCETLADRRAKRRALISAPVRVRDTDRTRRSLDEIGTTLNVSRLGVLIETSEAAYFRGMDVMVTFPYSHSPAAIQAEQAGRVVRIVEAEGGRRVVAVALGVTHGADGEFVNAAGETVAGRAATNFLAGLDPRSAKPLVLLLDAQRDARESLRSYLANDGYDVIAVATGAEARAALEQCTPSLLIAEIEGDGLPGFDICVHCKSTPRLRHVPVMLTTSSAYPTDYANAHALGAVVCIARPYKQERLGHVVRLLAPPQSDREAAAPPRTPDPSRRAPASAGTAKNSAQSADRRFLFVRK